MDYTDATDAFNLSGSATKTLCNATMTNWGTTVWTNSGGLVLDCSVAWFYNQPGALFDVQTDQTT